MSFLNWVLLTLDLVALTPLRPSTKQQPEAVVYLVYFALRSPVVKWFSLKICRWCSVTWWNCIRDETPPRSETEPFGYLRAPLRKSRLVCRLNREPLHTAVLQCTEPQKGWSGSRENKQELCVLEERASYAASVGTGSPSHAVSWLGFQSNHDSALQVTLWNTTLS